MTGDDSDGDRATERVEAGGANASERVDPGVAARDELAGVVDLFGALSRSELEAALEELAFKAGSDTDDDAIDAAIDAALTEFYLVAFDPGRHGLEAATDTVADEELFAVGPAAFPALPDNAEDLPHILDVERRSVDREPLAETVRDRLAEEAETAVQAGDEDRIAELLDVCYDLEAWAPVDADEIRERLARELDD